MQIFQCQQTHTQAHVVEIEKKLLAIVGSVFDRQLSAWQVRAPVPSATFRSICKQLSKFHETISTLLLPVSTPKAH